MIYLYQLLCMYYQQGNSDLDQTMESSNIRFKIQMIHKEISHLRDQLHRIGTQIAQHQSQMKQLKDQQARFNILESQSILQNSQVSHAGHAGQYTLARSLSRSFSLQQPIIGHRQQAIQKYSFCVRHNQQESVACFTCKKYKCYACIVNECKHHNVYAHQYGLQKMEEEIYLQKARLVEQQVTSCEILMISLNEKKKELSQSVEKIFQFLKQQLEKKKIQIRLYLERQIKIRVDQMEFQHQQFKTILHHLNNSSRNQPKKFEDLQIWQRQLKSKFEHIRQQSRKQLISEAIKNMNFGPGNVQQIYAMIKKIDYQFDLSKKSQVKMCNLAQGHHRKQKLQIVQKKRER